MYALMIYSLKVGACLAVFYLFFKLFLSRETFHRLNRVVVLGAMVASFLLPLCVITIYREVPEPIAIQVVETVDGTEVVLSEPAAESFPWEQLAVAAFLVGAVVTLLWTCRSVWGVMRMIRRGRRELLEDKTVLVSLEQPVTPFSWWRYVVLSEKDLAENGDAILLHEKAHLHLRHSLDLLVTDLAGCLQWFNPAMWLLRRELRAIHEFEADEAVLDSGIDAKQYQLLLIKKAAGGRWYSVANSFNHSKLKTRITMMLRKRSSRWAGAKMLLLLPLTGLALGAFARTAYVYPDDKGKKETVTIRSRDANSSDAGGEKRKPLFLVDGREVGNIDTLSANRIESITVLKDSASRATYGDRGKDGVVFVSTKKSGTATVVSTDNQPLDDVVVIGYGVRDKTEEGKNNISVVASDSRSAQGVGEQGKVLWVIDGKVADAKSSSQLNPSQIASVSVLSGESARMKYPGRDFDHVVEVTSKAAAEAAAAKLGGEPVKVVRVSVARSDGSALPGNVSVVAQAGLEAAEAGMKAARKSLETARQYMPKKEWEEAKAELDNAQKELDKARKEKVSVEANSPAVAGGGTSGQNDEAKSDHWRVATGVGMTHVDRAQEKQGKTIFKGTITLDNPSEIPDDYAIFIDGKKASKTEMMQIPPKKIRRMEVFRGYQAAVEFGEGIRGGVRITTRR